MIKSYKTLKENKFAKPFDKKGLVMKLDEKRAASYVTKGELEEIGAKPKEAPKGAEKAPKQPKKDETKAPE